MSDITCIYEMNMIEENEQLESDILSGRGMELILCLMDGMANRRQIAERLGMPVYSVHLYLQRLLNAGLVKEKIQYVQNDQIEKYYELASSEIEIMNRIQGNNMDENEKRRKALLSSQHFAIMTRNAIKNVNINPEKPNKIKAYFMKARREDMEDFRKEIDLLFEKYQLKEDLDANDTYSLFTVLAPYEMED